MSPRSLVFVILLCACKREEHKAPPAPPTVAPAASSAPRTGTVTGHVRYEGTPDPRVKLGELEDPFCAKLGVDEPNVTRTGKDDALLDVVVHLANGTAKGDPALAPKAVVHQKGCAYSPHALGVLAGADIEFVNDDHTMHNIHGVIGHGSIGDQSVINFGLASGEPPKVIQAPKEPGVVRLKCDVHKFMRGYLVVSDHPFFANADDAGAFTLSKVPAGPQKLEAFHPVHGTKTATVEVKPDQTVAVDFVFSTEDKAQ